MIEINRTIRKLANDIAYNYKNWALDCYHEGMSTVTKSAVNNSDLYISVTHLYGFPNETCVSNVTNDKLESRVLFLAISIAIRNNKKEEREKTLAMIESKINSTTAEE